MDYIIVGTAGHVDHGKTALVKALTGVDTDRLKEEKKRGISIELGFASLQLPGGRRVGFVDVPGHERFIKQMLAGAGGMDLALLVVAADEGVMPQTKEHLAIIDLLQVKKGLVVITKIDLVEDVWLELVREEINEALKGSVLENAPIVEVSARTGKGMRDLIKALDSVAARTPVKNVGSKVRLPIDRSFSVTGFGTVVTGTLWSGVLNVNDILEILPSQKKARIRNLQVHGEYVQEARAGQRVALNLANVEIEEVKRGNILASPGYLKTSFLLDAQLHLLESAPWILKNRTRVRFHLGTSEILGRVILLDREELKPGQTSFVQMAMEQEVASMRHDRFVIRSYSPVTTIGGGVVIDSHPMKHKRFREKVITSLEAKLKGKTGSFVLETLREWGKKPATEDELKLRTSLPSEDFFNSLEQFCKEGKIRAFAEEGTKFFLDEKNYVGLLEDVLKVLKDYHRQFPLRTGISKDEIRTRYFHGISSRAFNALLNSWEKEGKVAVKDGVVSMPSFEARPSPGQKKVLQSVTSYYLHAGFQPPRWSEVKESFQISDIEAEEVLQYLLRKGILIKVSEEIYFHREHLLKAKKLLEDFIKKEGSVRLGEARDLLQSSRKFVLPLLEYFDRTKLTKRVGEKRVLYNKP